MTNEIATKQLESKEVIFSPDAMISMKEFSEVMAEGKDVSIPKHLQGKPADCLAIIMQAHQWGMNPYSVAQKTHVVSGALGYEAQLVNAVVTSSTAIEGRFHYEYSGDWKSDTDPNAWVKVGATLRGEDQLQWGEPLYPCKVTTKNSPLWKTAPKQQASYLALKYWARLYTPHVIMGVYTSDELEAPKEIDKGPISAIRTEETINTDTGEVIENEAVEPVQSTEEHEEDFNTIISAIAAAKNRTMLNAAHNAAKAHLEVYPDDKEAIVKAFNPKQEEIKAGEDAAETEAKAAKKEA